MIFDVVFTRLFKKKYLNKKMVSKQEIVQKAREIEQGIFYDGEGQIDGSKMIYKKRIAFEQTSKRKGGRVLVLLFQRTQKIYFPYAIWTAGESVKHRMDERLKNRKERQKIIFHSLLLMEEAFEKRKQKFGSP